MDEKVPGLYTLMQQLSGGSKAHICVHFVNSDFAQQSCFTLPFEGIIHRCHFCDGAKTTRRGLDCCLKNKRLSVTKAFRLGHGYVGTCYLGLTEIVTPCYFDGAPVCVIYIGNLLEEEQRQQTKRRILRICRRTGVDAPMLLNCLKTAQPFRGEELQGHIQTARLLAFFIRSMIREIRLDRSLMPSGAQKSNRWIIEQVQRQVQANYSTDLRLASIAALYYINSQYLCRLFSREAGVSFTEYLNRERIRHAQALLSRTDQSMTEIALSVGFNSVPYFNTTFKRYAFCTPSQYRAACGHPGTAAKR